jgi:hypothetical protein
VLASLLGIRPEDRRVATFAFLTLLGLMTAHSLLETARDTLFLSHLPARDLPLAYVAIAVIAFLIAAVSRRFEGAVPRRIALSIALVLGGAITASFGFWVTSESTVALISLYVWTGVLATIVVVQFWLLVAHALDFGQAKRTFAIIGAGGLVGAVLGSATAGGLLMMVAPSSLLFVSGSIFAVTAALPQFLTMRRAAPGAKPKKIHDARPSFTLLREEPYLRRMLWVALLSSMLFTGVDFVFKAQASVDLAPDQLGPFFARFYAVSSVLALLVQVFAAPRLLRVLGVNGSLLVLPSLLLVSSAGFVLTGGLGAALLMRGTDGTLRHSLHRTGTEILSVPLLPAVRDRFKGFVEAVGQRGGQGLASLLLLAATSVGARPLQIGCGLIAFAALWIVVSSGIKPHYLELFRRNLRQGVLETHVEVPDLDLNSLEALIAALSSPNDYEVTAALDLLASFGKTNLIPALILYHPSTDVVLRAFSLLSGSDRPDLDRLVERLIQHEDDRIRAAALRFSAARSEQALLESMAKDPSPLVHTTAVVELIGRGAIDEAKGALHLRNIVDGNSSELRRALAVSARDLPRGRYPWTLVELAFRNEDGLDAEVARSMAAAPELDYVPTLVRLLGDRDCREDARAAIIGLGDPALGSLDDAMGDLDLPRSVRRHLPRTISLFTGTRAAEVLERHIATEPDELVASQIVRGLGRLRATDPTLAVDRRMLLERSRAALQRAVTLLFWRVTSHAFTGAEVTGRSAVAELLGALLSDKESLALESVFRILKVLDPSEEFEILFAGLRSTDARRRENGRELLSHVVPEPLRGGILAMLGDGPPTARLSASRRFHDPEGCERFERVAERLGASHEPTRAVAMVELGEVHAECLRRMLLDSSDALRGVASYRIAELGLDELVPELRTQAAGGQGALAELSERAVDLFEQQALESSRVG